MAGTTTAKRGLYKPDREDFVSVVSDINNNMDNLDDALPDRVIAVDYNDLVFPVSEGTKCYHNGHYYVANQDIATSEDFVEGHWDEITVSDLIDDLQEFVGDTALPTTAQTITGAIAEQNVKKADKVTSATNGHFAGLDANGNLVDSGKQASDFATPVDVEKKADAIEESNSTEAEVMSFSDGADNLPMEVAVAINPVQDLHGYPSPWVGGAGKNILPCLLSSIKSGNTNGTWDGDDYSLYGITFKFATNAEGYVTSIEVSGTATANATVRVYADNTGLPADSYIASGCPSGGTSNTYYLRLYNVNGSSGGTAKFEYGNGVSVDNTYTIKRINVSVDSGNTVSGLVFKPMVRLSTETDATFVPYSNICPITGWTQAKITRVKEQFYDLDTVQKKKYVDATGAVKTSTYNSDRALNLTDYFNVEEGKSYTLKANTSDLGNTQTVAFSWYNGTTFVDRSSATVNLNGERYTFTATVPTGINRARVNFNTNDFDTVIIAESGTIAEYTIAFPSEAGTVYGGTLTINKDGTGTLLVDRVSVKFSDADWNRSESGGAVSYKYVAAGKKSGYITVISSAYRTGTQTDSGEGTITGRISTTNVFIVDSRYDSTADWLNVVGNETLVYELANPVTYNFTAQQIRSLLGENNLWADSGNVLSVVYYADTKMYIDNLFNSILPATGVSF